MFYNIFLLLVVNTVADLIDNEINGATGKSFGNYNMENSVEEKHQNFNVVYEASPCTMIYSKYGCCWDQKSIPLGPNGQGCPACKDHSHMRCKNWKNYCHDPTVSNICPRTCGKCSSKKSACKNSKDWDSFCPMYEKVGFCKFNQIANQCKRTCNLC